MNDKVKLSKFKCHTYSIGTVVMDGAYDFGLSKNPNLTATRGTNSTLYQTAEEIEDCKKYGRRIDE